MCKHEKFDTQVRIACFEDTGGFNAEVEIKCAQCGVPMEFQGVEPGIDLHGCRVSVDGSELRVAIAPRGTKPNPLQRMRFGIRKFDA